MGDLDKLYGVLSKDPGYEVGTQEEFASKFSDSVSLQKLHSVLEADEKYNTGDWDSFYGKFGVKKKDEVSGAGSEASSAPQSTSPSINDGVEDQFPFLKGDTPPPVTEPSSTRVEPPVMDKDVVHTSELAKKYGIQPAETVVDIQPAYEKPAELMINKWAEEKYQASPDLRDAMDQTQRSFPIYEQTGKDLRTGVADPNLYQKMAKNRMGELTLNALRAPNDWAVEMLRTIDDAERVFYDAVSGGNLDHGGLFSKAADYMEESLQNNWPEPDKNTVTGKLVYDFFGLVPFFGEIMATPSIGKFGQLENLLTTKGFVNAYADADHMQGLGYAEHPLTAGLEGAVKGYGEAAFFHLMGYAGSKAGEVAAKASGYGDVGVATSMVSNALGFGAYDGAMQYLETGEVDWSQVGGSTLLGGMLGTPAGMQVLGNRAMKNYYGTSGVNVGRVREMPFNVVQLRGMAENIRGKAEAESNPRKKASLFLGAERIDAAADIKAYELIVVRDPEATKKSIAENEYIPEVKKKEMEAQIDASVAFHELAELTKDLSKAEDTLKETPQRQEDGVSPEKGTETPLKEEKPSETPKTKPEQVKEKSAEYDKRTLELLNEFEKEGESGNYAEAVANIDVKIAELSKAGKHAEANKLEALLKEVEENKYFKKQGDVKLEKTQEIREFVEGKVEQIKTEQDALQEETKAEAKEAPPKAEEVEGAPVQGASDRPLAASIEKDYFTSAKPGDVPPSMIDPPPKPPPPEEGGKPPKSAKQKELDKIDARRAEEAKLASNKGERKRELQHNIVDVREPWNAALKKEGGPEAQRALNRGNQEAGASSNARRLVEIDREAVFGKGSNILSDKQQEFLSNYKDLHRTIEIDKMMAARREEIIKIRTKAFEEEYLRYLTAEEKTNLEANVRLSVEKEFENIKHEGYLEGGQAETILEMYRNQDPDLLAKFELKSFDQERVDAAVKAYDNVMQRQLRRRYEAGLITKGAYEKLSREQPHYSPRKYIAHMESVDPGGTLSGIKTLGGGSYGAKVVDMNTLLTDNVSRTEALIARNRKHQALADYAEVGSDLVQNAPFSEAFKTKLKEKEQGAPYMEPEFEKTPDNRINVDYKKDGQTRRLWIDKDLYKYYEPEPPSGTHAADLSVLSFLSGTPIIKFFATGANPEFAVKNLPIDALHAWLTTETWSSSMGMAMAEMLVDYKEVWSDAVKRKGAYKDAMDEGIGMGYLTTQGLIHRKHGKYNKKTYYTDKTRDAMAWMGETSEILTRLAIRNREIKKAVKQAEQEGREISAEEMKEIQRDATAAARRYLDFSQGGSTVKMLDKFVPYLSAGVQVTRGSLRAAYNTPVTFGLKIAQLGMLSYGLTQWNTGNGGDDEMSASRRNSYMNDISPAMKARNFIIMTNWKYQDKNGADRFLYFQIPKDALQSSLSSAVEATYIKRNVDSNHKVLDKQALVALQNEFRNVPDLASAPPTIKAMMGWMLNYDLFYQSDIFPGGADAYPKGDRQNEYIDGVTPERYIKFGEWTGVSPMRFNYAMKQFLTESNVWMSALSELGDWVVGGGSMIDNTLNRSVAETAKKFPFARRVLKSTYPRPSEEAKEAQQEINVKQDHNDHLLNQLMDDGKRKISEIPDDEMSAFIQDVYERDDQLEAERIIKRLKFKLKGEGVSPEITRLKFDAYHPHARAVGFYVLLKKSPNKAESYWEQAKQAGILSDEFGAKVEELLAQDEETTNE